IQGTYTVAASAAGYLEQVAEDVMVEGITTQDFALEPEPCLPPLNLEGVVLNEVDVYLTWQSSTAVDRSTNRMSLLGYNVYRDGVKINTSLVMETQYTDMDLAPGSYTYYVTAKYTLCESEPSNTITVQGVSIDELLGSMINVYPVPAKDYVNIEVSDNVRELRVINYVGQVVLEQNVGQDKSFQLNTSTLSSGSYMIEFTSEDGNIITRRIVISR
ncbi:MAG: T9SS type A sorting domain-containing protein, partial [Bacteroidetes bacterium]|nr:T9SS type A sorting domain-containing protein [Bacteroidota bacterium]